MENRCRRQRGLSSLARRIRFETEGKWQVPLRFLRLIPFPFRLRSRWPSGSRLVNQGQIARLLMQHRTALYGYIFACVRQHADAEDILQNVSVAVMESIGQLRDEAGFLPWAREIARRRVLAHRRTSRREKPCDPEIVRALAGTSDRVEQGGTPSAPRAGL